MTTKPIVEVTTPKGYYSERIADTLPDGFGNDDISRELRKSANRDELIRRANELFETLYDIYSADAKIRLGWLRRKDAWMKEAK